MFSFIDFCAGSSVVSQLLVKLWAYFDDSVLVSFPVAMIKYPGTCDLKEAVFIFLTIPNYTPSLQVSQLVISHLQLRAERRELTHASWVQLSFFTPTQVRVSYLWNDTTHSGLGFPHLN